MKNIVFVLIIGFLCIRCTDRKLNNKEVLTAKWKLEFGESFELKLFPDSTYFFNFIDTNYSHKIDEKYRGRYYFNNDTIIFYPLQFEYLKANKAVIKNNFIEFLDGKYPFKMKIILSSTYTKAVFDTTRFSDYALFIYDPKFYSYFPDSVKPYDLNENDLEIIDNLLNQCIQENSNISKKIIDYNKQCSAILTEDNEKVVRVYCLCKGSFRESDEYKYRLMEVHDGGDCFFSVKINITKRMYFDLHINGHA